MLDLSGLWRLAFDRPSPLDTCGFEGVGGKCHADGLIGAEKVESWVGRVESPVATRPAPPASTNPSDSGNEKNNSRTTRWSSVSVLSAIGTKDLIDERLPLGADRLGDNDFIPHVDEQCTVDDRFNVRRQPFPKDDLVGPSALPPVAQT